MKLIALLGAGAVAAGTMVAAAPADAQHYGHGRYDRHHDERVYRRGDYRPHRSGYRYRGYGQGYGRGGYGYRGRGHGYGHRRVVCRIHRGWHGPERRCFTVYR